MFKKTKHQIFVAVTILSMSGCAFSSMDDRAKLTNIQNLESNKSFDARNGVWPANNWWKSYNDKQLDELITVGLKNSPDLAIALARVAQSNAYVKVAASPLYPQLDANAAATSQKQSANYLMPAPYTPQGWQDYGQGTINLNWEIDFWGKNRAALSAATSENEASKTMLEQTKLIITSSIALSYAKLAELYAERDTLDATIKIREKALKLFEERYKNGIENKSSVSESEARLASAEGELLSIDEQIAIVKNQIAALIGAGPDEGLKIKRPSASIINKYTLPDDISLNLIGRRADIVAAKLEAEAKASRIKVREAAFYPNVNLSAFIGLQSLGLNKLTDTGSDFGSVGPAIYLPIFTGGRLTGELKNAEAAYDEAVANYNKTLTHALEEVANVGVSQKILNGQIKTAQNGANAANNAYKIAKTRYERGLSNYIEVLYASDNLQSSERNLARLKAKSLILDIEMKKALGGGYKFN